MIWGYLIVWAGYMMAFATVAEMASSKNRFSSPFAAVSFNLNTWLTMETFSVSLTKGPSNEAF